MNPIRLFFLRLKFRFLGRFREVQLARTAEDRFREHLRAAEKERFEAVRELATVKSENERLKLALEEKQHALVIVTEARMNAERTNEVVRGQLTTLQEVSERELHTMKQTVDWMSLETGHRQIFGTSPQFTKPQEDETAAPPTKISARMASRVLTQQFYEEALRRGQKPPENGAEYSSTQQFSTNSVAVAGG